MMTFHKAAGENAVESVMSVLPPVMQEQILAQLRATAIQMMRERLAQHKTLQLVFVEMVKQHKEGVIELEAIEHEAVNSHDNFGTW